VGLLQFRGGGVFPKLTAEGERGGAGGWGGEDVLIGECCDELSGGGGCAVDAGGEPGLRGDGDLG